MAPPPAAVLRPEEEFLQVLTTPHTLDLFSEFARGEYSDESLRCWIAIEQFKRATDVTAKNIKANSLVDRFVNAGAEYEIRIDDNKRRKLKAAMGTEEFSTLVQELQTDLFRIMLQDQWPRFVVTAAYVNSKLHLPQKKPVLKKRSSTSSKRSESAARVNLKDLEIVSVDQVIADPFGLNLLHAFVKQEHSEENLEFWLSLEEWKSMEEGEAKDRKSIHIYDNFIVLNSKFELGVSSKERNAIIQRIKERPIPADIYADAEKYAFKCLQNDILPRFILTDAYPAFTAERKKRLEMERNSTVVSVTHTHNDSVIEEEDDPHELTEILSSLTNVLNDDRGLYWFIEFAKSEFSDENIRFWRDVSLLLLSVESDQKKSQMQEIFDKYVKAGSEFEVRVDDATRRCLKEALAANQMEDFNRAIKTLQNDVLRFMEQDQWPRFKTSEFWRKCRMDIASTMRTVTSSSAARSDKSSSSALPTQPVPAQPESTSESTLKSRSSSGSVKGSAVKADPSRSPTPDQLRLQDILNHSDGIKYLKQFTEHDKYYHLISFWLAVEQFKNLLAGERRRTADQIYLTHLRPDAAEPVRIEPSTCQAIESTLAFNTSIPLTLFNPSQLEVCQILEDEIYDRFVSSSFYQTFFTQYVMKPHKMSTPKNENQEPESPVKRSLFGRTRSSRADSTCELPKVSVLPQVQLVVVQPSAQAPVQPQSPSRVEAGVQATNKVEASAQTTEQFLSKRVRVEPASTTPESTAPLKVNQTEMPAGSIQRQPHADLNRFANSVENLAFRELLDDEFGTDLFISFATGEHSDENIRFWRSVQMYKSIESKDDKRSKAVSIMDEFLLPQSRHEVVISEGQRQSIQKVIQECTTMLPDHLFDQINTLAFRSMEADIFPRFARTGLYKQYILDRKKYGKRRSTVDSPTVYRNGSTDISAGLPRGGSHVSSFTVVDDLSKEPLDEDTKRPVNKKPAGPFCCMLRRNNSETNMYNA
eukprot:GILK01002723.1.p1 GENE.GILK01002723.1~~GILK01002723.1.p1  ORF type:complete len:1012 (-),score=241.04 GILK01002723.1:205-3156(-)